MVEQALEQTVETNRMGTSMAMSVLHRVASRCLVDLVSADPTQYKTSAVAEVSWLTHWLGNFLNTSFTLSTFSCRKVT